MQAILKLWKRVTQFERVVKSPLAVETLELNRKAAVGLADLRVRLAKLQTSIQELQS